MIYMLVIPMTLLGSVGAFFLKKCSESASGVMSLLKCPQLYCGGALYGAGVLLNIFLLCYLDYSVLYPMCAITYVWSLLLSKWKLGERITQKKVLGVLCICAGVVFVAI